MVERTNKSVIPIFRTSLSSETEWAAKLQDVTSVLKHASSSSTGQSPRFFLFVRDPPAQEITAPVDPTPAQIEKTRNTVKIINDASCCHDCKMHDLVVVRRHAIYKEPNTKLRRGWIEPCLILADKPFAVTSYLWHCQRR